ncbi:nucleotidyltransferase family protein [Alteromonas sp. a30]|uniref:nucleotidyltransferase family protein n=1 Tax=Alteromonas sp. a30 TaxID=2730917 RepID=UPI0022809804|nr:nucleotidyltransferase family protein [Alteromonas sp. a30]MCY7293926.1 nucleotidyltransferase family protein [Alteromonas sp. a30]
MSVSLNLDSEVNNAPQYRLACLLLAAGEAKRFGSAKQLLACRGKTLIERAVKEIESAYAVTGLSGARIFVAIGAHHQAITLALKEASFSEFVTFIDINQWQFGMGQSLAESVSHISPFDFTHLLVALADQVALQEQDFTTLIANSIRRRSQIVASRFSVQMKHTTQPESQSTQINALLNKDVIGAPAIFPAHYFPALMQLQGDVGARKVIQQSDSVVTVSLPNAAIDIDTPQDWQQWNKTNLET